MSYKPIEQPKIDFFKFNVDDLQKFNKSIEFDEKIDIQSFNFEKVGIPQFVERVHPSKRWIDFGLDNQFPQYLQSLLTKSSLHETIVNSKARMIGGHGWLKTNLDLKTMLFLRNAKSDYDLDEILYKVAIDLEVYGSFSLNIIWAKDRESISEIKYQDVSKLRIQSPDPKHKYPQIDNYWVSDGWEKPDKFQPELYQGFSTRAKRNRNQILYIKHYQAGTEYYGRVEYLPAIRDMETDWLIRDWTMNSVKNGYTPGFIITIPGIGSSPEQRRGIANRIISDFGGTTNANVGYIQFTNNSGESPKFEPIELNNSDQRFQLTDEMIERSILKAHAVKNPKLYGAGTEGGITIGTSKNEMLEAIEIFQNDYATPKQNILEKVFNRLARINGITDNLIIKKYSEGFRKVDTNLKDVMDVLTATIGQQPLPKEQQYWILVQNGYTHEIASKLTQYDGGDSLSDKVDDQKLPTAKPLNQSIDFESMWNELRYMTVDSKLNKFDFESHVNTYFNIKHPKYMGFSKQSEIQLQSVPEPPLSKEELEWEIELELKIKESRSWEI